MLVIHTWEHPGSWSGFSIKGSVKLSFRADTGCLWRPGSGNGGSGVGDLPRLLTGPVFSGLAPVQMHSLKLRAWRGHQDSEILRRHRSTWQAAEPGLPS